MRLYIAFGYLLLWLVLAFKWVPDFVLGITTDPIYRLVINIGVDATLLIPLYQILVLKIKK